MSDAYLLRAENVSKRFGHVQALKNVALGLKPNEVLGLVGDNAAGKSTLIKILSGALPADSAQIYFEESPVKIQNPLNARELGIETIYQNLALVGNLPIYMNIFLVRPRTNNYLRGMLRILDQILM